VNYVDKRPYLQGIVSAGTRSCSVGKHPSINNNFFPQFSELFNQNYSIFKHFLLKLRAMPIGLMMQLIGWKI
jgi:hypothetical protein